MDDHHIRLGKLQEKILKHILECKNMERPFGAETVIHIARCLGCSQPTIFKSVRVLIQRHYLDSVKFESRYYGGRNLHDLNKTGGQKALFVTAKGAAAAIVFGVNMDKLEKYLDYINDDDKFFPANYKVKTYMQHINEHYDQYKEKHPKYHVDENLVDYDDLKKVNPHEPTATILRYVRRLVEPHSKTDVIVKKAMTYALENNYFENDHVTKRLTTAQIRKLQLFVAIQHIQALGDIPILKEFVNKYGIDKVFLKKHLMRQREYINLAIKELN
jgi:hypothetical protein